MNKWVTPKIPRKLQKGKIINSCSVRIILVSMHKGQDGVNGFVTLYY